MKITDRTQAQPPRPPEKERPKPPPPPEKIEQKAETPKPRNIGRNLDVQA